MNIVDQSPPRRRTLRILLVRPQDSDCSDTEERLTAAGHIVSSVASGKELARMLSSRPFNLILLEGPTAATALEVVAAVHGQSGRLSTRYTPTFALINASSTGPGLPWRVDGIMAVPLDTDALVSAYVAFLSTSLSSVNPGEAKPVCEIDAAIERLGGDLELYKDLVARFLDDTAGTCRQLESAQAGRDAATMHRAAHSLKGLAACVGATTVAGVLGELEALGRAEDFETVPAVWQRFQCEMAVAADRLAMYRRSHHCAQPYLA